MLRPQRIEPGPGQESVWDYPRPPRIEDVSKPLKVIFNGEVIAETNRAKRVLETSHPPVYYIPPEDVKMECLIETPRRTFCEWKGSAGYYNVSLGDKEVLTGAWFYPETVPQFDSIKNWVGFYADKMDACYVGEEQVQPQPGDFYGGWITQEIVGPFKGGPGTWGW